ncbi:hypothetical protein N9V62_00495 [Porticoccaceae bacterium]|nr:hypothetical protein [Porticoccaceae bacterium]
MRVLIELDFDAPPTKKDVESYLSDLIADGSLDFTLDSETTPLPDSEGLETYSAVCLSTEHLAPSDLVELTRLARDPGQVLERDTGFFVKLCEECEYNLGSFYSDELDSIIKWAHALGYRIIEFDCDVEVLSQFPVFEH